MNSSRLWLLLLAISLVSQACKSNDDDKVINGEWLATPTVNSPISALKQEITLQPEVKSGSEFQIITFSDSSKLWFSYLNDSITGLPSQVQTQYQVEFLSLLKPGNVIRMGRPTESIDGILNSRGSFYYRLSKGGNTYSPYHLMVSLPAISGNRVAPTQLQLFNGITISGQNLWAPIISNDSLWRVQQGVLSQIRLDSAPEVDSFSSLYTSAQLFSHNYRWVNLDQLQNYPNPKQILRAQLPQSFTPLNTIAFFVGTRDFIVAALSPDLGTVTFNSRYEIPVGMNMKLVTLTKKDNKYFWGLYTGEMPAQGNISIQPTEVTKAQLLANLDQL